MVDAGRIELRLRIRLGDAIAMGPGKADLLDAIAQHGSISAAARALGVSQPSVSKTLHHAEDNLGFRLFQLSRGRSMAVKPFIMDNAVVVGVGNIYATEALFAAGIDPRREAKGISRARYLKLAIEIKRILAAAIERGGTTLRDFIGGDGQPGYFQQSYFVYGRDGEACRVCGTAIRSRRLGNRSTFFCTACQR